MDGNRMVSRPGRLTFAASQPVRDFPTHMDLLYELEIECPYCGESIAVTIDTSPGDHTTIEDCAVCCRPIQLVVRCEPGEVIGIEAEVA